ncbi:hypothetical protein B0J12DRAFT_754970 [Macrophomina phaseolina]|uniref:Carrier domain-containing protein n=1 Tax=Macrophomina phaseolina TaxID=35725 RepID=A0ABQ8G8A0_9PEZI|nr:hypothetical protein B0J12DRAFT_754970 [Macrophomina phaseolina]
MLLNVCSERATVLSAIAKALNLPVDSIDASKSFIELGGHSLSAVEVQNECRRLVRRPPTVLSLLVSSSINELLPTSNLLERNAGLAMPVSEERAATVLYDSSPSATATSLGPDEAPVTEMQAALILGGQSTIRYFETWRLEDLVVLKHAWKTVISMEPIFRAAFEECAAGSYVMRLQDFTIPWDEVVTFDRQTYEVELSKQETLSRPAFKFKTVIYRSPDRSQSEGTIVFWVHHALLDGFSMSNLTQKVRRVAVGDTGVVPGRSFLSAAQELQQLREKSEHLAVEFWSEKTAQFATASTGLGLARPKNACIQAGGNEVDIDFSALQHRLRDTSRALGVTVASFFYAAWAVVQALYTDADAVVVGAIFSGRDLPIEDATTVIGPLLNTLPLHIPIGEDESTSDLVRRVFRDLAELTCFQWSSTGHGFSRNFEAALSVTRGLQGPAEDPIRPLRESGYDFESNIPLSLAIDEAAFSLRLVYHPDLYTRESAEGVALCFQNALERLTYSTSIRQCLGSLVPVSMQGRLRVLGNCLSGSTTRTAHPEDLVSLFETAVRSYPDNPAVEFGQEVVTYAELGRQTSQIAAVLDRLNIEGEVVCVHADGSLHWIVGLLGSLKAGATVCSLDATLPANLRSSMFSSSGSRVFIIGNESQICFQPAGCRHCLVADNIISSTPVPAREPGAARIPNPAGPAYLCFTSGSTGTPKGVLCTHQGLVAFQKDPEVRLHAAPGVRISQFMSPAFDGSIHEIFSALCYGATLVLRSSADVFDVLRHVDSAIMTPSVARTIAPEHFQNLKSVYLVGEQVPTSTVDQWAPGRKLYNMYGPTEGTCGATITRLLPGRPVTIGRPNPTSRVYILGRNGRLVPPGAIGEIHIAGVQVSLGYLNMARETYERFLPDTICPDLGERMYKTGDRGFWDSNGEVVCLGRNDRQIKLRGFRMDLDDLEARIMQVGAGIRAVALTVAQGRSDTLVAMVQPGGLDPKALQEAIRARLPRQAVPSAIACVDSFPMTRAGKVDLKAVAARLAEI